MEIGIYAGIALAVAGVAYVKGKVGGGPADATVAPARVHFGVPLTACPQSTRMPGVPAAAAVLFELIRPHVGIEGIFRVPGDKGRVEALRAELEAMPVASAEDDNSADALAIAQAQLPAAVAGAAGLNASRADSVAHVATSVLKMWLRELPAGDKLLAGMPLAAGRRGSSDADVHEVVQALPAPRRAMLRVLLDLGTAVVAQSDANRMSFESFAICLAPALFEDPDLADPGVLDTVKDQRKLLLRLLAWHAAGRAAGGEEAPAGAAAAAVAGTE